MRAPGRGQVLALAALLIAGCSLLPGPTRTPDDQLPVGVRVVTPPALLRLNASNATTIPVVLVVNGTARNMTPGTNLDLGVADLGPLPWNAELRNDSGRPLLKVVVNDGDTSRLHGADGSVEYRGAAGRVDLSCGQLRLSTIETLRGPAPGRGTPGDCD